MSHENFPRALLDLWLSTSSYFKLSCFPRGSGGPGALGRWRRGGEGPRGRRGAARDARGSAGRPGGSTLGDGRRKGHGGPGRPRGVGLAEDLAPAKMTDTGMWIWAGVLTAVGLVASYVVAVWWQRRQQGAKDGKS